MERIQKVRKTSGKVIVREKTKLNKQKATASKPRSARFLFKNKKRINISKVAKKKSFYLELMANVYC